MGVGAGAIGEGSLWVADKLSREVGGGAAGKGTAGGCGFEVDRCRQGGVGGAWRADL